MDVGRFKRRTSILLAWLLIPLVLAASIHVFGQLYSHAVSLKRTGMVSSEVLLPVLKEKYREAEEALSEYRVPKEQIHGSADNLSALFQEAGLSCGVRVNSVVIEKPQGRGTPGSPTLEVAVSGNGPLESIIQYLDLLQEHRSLFVVSNVSLRITEFHPETIYSCNFAFLYHEVNL